MLLTLSKCLLAGQDILGLKQPWFLFYVFLNQRIHAQSEQRQGTEDTTEDKPKENIFG